MKTSSGDTAPIPIVDEAQLQRAIAAESYNTDRVRLVHRDLSGMTHLVATRKGLYAVNESEWRPIAFGSFFGLAVQPHAIHAFEACGEPRDDHPRGRIVRFALQDGHITGSTIEARALDNGCHGIDFLDDRLHIVDTYNQRLIRLTPQPEVLTPLPTAPNGRWNNTDPEYRHANSILHGNGMHLVLLHNSSEHTGRNSELDVYDANWNRLMRLPIPGRSCHGLSVLEDGTLLICDSTAGDIVTLQGERHHVSDFLTRGLAIGPDSVVVGSCPLARRGQRHATSGTITFMRRDYSIRTVLDIPGAPTEIRRLDGNDFGQSQDLRQRSTPTNIHGVHAS